MSNKKISSNHRWFVLLFVLCIFIAGIIQLKTNKERDRVIKSVIVYQDSLSGCDLHLKNMRLKIRNFELVNDEKDTVFVSDLTEDIPKILFVYKEQTCKACVFNYLNALNKSFSREQVIILTYNNDFKMLKYLKQDFNVDFDFYIVPDHVEIADSIQYPFFAVLSKEMRLEYIYTPRLDKYDEFKKIMLVYKTFL